jgi:hypothetical protein
MLAGLQIETEFDRHECRADEYLDQREGDAAFVSSFEVAGQRVQVYVYPDGAGFFVGRRWYPFEREDYDSPAQLVSALSGTLREKVMELRADEQDGETNDE